MPLLPGTHHLKFLVDDQMRLTKDYPTAVDDRDGTLANYVAVPAPSTAPSQQVSTSTSPINSPHFSHPNQYNSFWSDASSGPAYTGKKGEAVWTSEIPLELIAAAAEEEAYLASADSPTSSASGVPAPNIPPAPVLPRHLDKLILNVRPNTVTGPVNTKGNHSSHNDRDRRRAAREREKARREHRDNGRAHRPLRLDTTTTGADPARAGDENSTSSAAGAPPALSLSLPVVTAAGAEVMGASGPPTPPATQSRLVDGPAIADDGSVLPVPSHVVLHHLSTSAIRNGVLAVANTTRYKKKVCIHLRSFTVRVMLTIPTAVYNDHLLQADMTRPRVCVAQPAIQRSYCSLRPPLMSASS